MGKRLLVIGAGPAGLAAALSGRERGFEVTVLEAGEVGESLLRWGPARFFTPLSMNRTEAVRRCLGEAIPPGDALLTGAEMAERVLRPLAASSVLQGAIRTGHRVTAVGRAGLTRMDMEASAVRAERPFRVVAETREGERVFAADVVLDASGVTGQPCAIGTGGLPARGERGLGGRIARDLGAVHRALGAASGKSILVVGHGHSAATAIAWLAAIAEREPATRVTWAVRTADRRPCAEVADDPLPERQRIAAAANDLAANPPGFLDVQRWTTVEAVDDRAGRIRVLFGKNREADFDVVASLTGYRPDLGFLSELALEISPVSEGGGRLWKALAGVTDPHSAPGLALEDLQSGEPGFFLVGAKSYGRSRNFLLQPGFAHIETILAGFSL